MRPDLDLPCTKTPAVYDACLSVGTVARQKAEVRAKAICGTCAHVTECLRVNADLEGVVGGMTLAERVDTGIASAA